MKNYIYLFTSMMLLFSMQSTAQVHGKETKPVAYKDFFSVDTTVYPCYLPPNQKTKEIDIHDLPSGKYSLDLFFNNEQRDQVTVNLIH